MEFNRYNFNLPVLNLFWFDALISWQSIAAEEVEYYAMYDPDIMTVAFYLIIFKAIENFAILCFDFCKSRLHFSNLFKKS